MADVNNLVYYSIIAAVPLYFVCYSLFRIIYHARDGVETEATQEIYKAQLLKRVLIGILIAINLFMCGSGYSQHLELTELYVRSVYYGLNAVCWIMSFVLLAFEYNRRLPMQWIGQRGYWPCSCLLNCCTVTIIAIEDQSQYINGVEVTYIRIGLLGVCAVDSFVLGLMAFYKPNDFYAIRQESDYYKIPRLDMNSEVASIAPGMLGPSSPTDALLVKLRCKIRDFRSKMDTSASPQSVILYQIEKYLNGAWVGKVQRSYAEFEQLFSDLEGEKVGNLPQFPHFAPKVPVDDRMTDLEGLLNNLCRLQVQMDPLLDFLEISGSQRDQIEGSFAKSSRNSLLYESEITERSDSVEQSYFNTQMISTLDKTASPLSTPDGLSMIDTSNTDCIQTYFAVTAKQPVQKRNYVAYEFEILGLGGCSLHANIHKRYRDFSELNDALKKVFAPGKPPEIPGRHALQKFWKGTDPQFIETRKLGLELYLMNLLNDPAFHCAPLFAFLDQPSFSHINEVWLPKLAMQAPTYTLKDAIRWEAAVDSSQNHYYLYLFKIEKHANGSISNVWTQHRRYKEFNDLHKHLLNRQSNPNYLAFLEAANIGAPPEIPSIPRKSLAPLMSMDELNTRREGLELFLRSLFEIPWISEASAFRVFIGDK